MLPNLDKFFITGVWPNIFVEPANLTVHMSTLRRAPRDERDGNRFIINKGAATVSSPYSSCRSTRTERNAPAHKLIAIVPNLVDAPELTGSDATVQNIAAMRPWLTHQS
jgi:hypothetical protein